MNITIVLGDKIPSIKYGGTQRVMWYLGKELNKRGHKVTFIAGKGSSCPFAKVIELDPSVNLNTQIPTDADIVQREPASSLCHAVRMPYHALGFQPTIGAGLVGWIRRSRRIRRSCADA